MREDFSGQVKVQLALRAGHRCAVCGATTGGPHSDQERGVNIGVASHITAASPGGPRFDPQLSSDERTSARNGIWTCQNCGHLVDQDHARFKVEELRRLKQDREAGAEGELGRPGGAPGAASQSILEERRILDLERRRDVLREIVGSTLGDVHVLLTQASMRNPGVELRNEALRLHNLLDGKAALFVTEFPEIQAALVVLGNWVGTWWNPAWPITTEDHARFSEMAGRIRAGLVAVETALEPRPLSTPILDVLSAAIAGWLECLITMRDLTEEDYDRLQPASVLPDHGRGFDRALLTALPLLDESATKALYDLRTQLTWADFHARVRPNPIAYLPGGLRDAMVERGWHDLEKAHQSAVAALRKAYGAP